MSDQREPRLTIFGATGYTGRLCAAEAVARGVPLRLAGRRRDALDALAAELGAEAGLPAAADVAVADVADPASVRALAEPGGVLLSTVGPYLRMGAAALDAALAGGAHYIDITGELPFIQRVRDRHDEAAAAGVGLCPAFGFDGFPGDLLAAVAADGFGDVREARVAYLVRDGRPSRGTMRSIIGMLDEGGRAVVDGRPVDEPVAASGWAVPFPDPLGVRHAISAPLPDALTIAAWSGAREVRAYAVTAGARSLPRVAAPLASGLRTLLRTPVRGALETLVARLPEGPGQATRERAKAAVLVELSGPSGTRRAWARLRDPYHYTARSSVAAAQRLLAEGPPRPGALTPAELFGAAQAGGVLDGTGVRWELLG